MLIGGNRNILVGCSISQWKVKRVNSFMTGAFEPPHHAPRKLSVHKKLHGIAG
jgi:hypothetical protein